ncbi:uncharacterized protein RSE6_00641 [Rhynchosporium secalis]|uniref:Uncharacterized protein n=1 Tax=Rhynchosporium secalis TaxID=38038 RepID=A0A1E1LVR9_RHYSE|nr:uncharacterized protein RSE6_00641 [Rhynchosporium secalis]
MTFIFLFVPFRLSLDPTSTPAFERPIPASPLSPARQSTHLTIRLNPTPR